MGYKAGESKRDGLRVNFDRRPELEFHDFRIASDARPIVCRERDDARLNAVAVPRDLSRKTPNPIDDPRRKPVPARAKEIHGGVKWFERCVWMMGKSAQRLFGHSRNEKISAVERADKLQKQRIRTTVIMNSKVTWEMSV